MTWPDATVTVAALALLGFALWIFYRWRMHRQHFSLNRLGFELEKTKIDIMVEKERLNIEHARMHLDEEKAGLDRGSKRIGARAGRGPFSGGTVIPFRPLGSTGDGPPPEVLADLKEALEKARQMDPEDAKEFLKSRGYIMTEGMPEPPDRAG